MNDSLNIVSIVNKSQEFIKNYLCNFNTFTKVQNYFNDFKNFHSTRNFKVESSYTPHSDAIVIVLVEGKSDKVFLSRRISELYPDIKIIFHVFNGDIFSSVPNNNIQSYMNNTVKRICKVRKIRLDDVLLVVNVLDTDGSFISSNRIEIDEFIETNAIYTDNKIYTKNSKIKTSLIERNISRRKSILKMISTKNLQGGIPYRLFYFSRNVEHVVFGYQGASIEHKISRLDKISKKAALPLEIMLENHLPDLTGTNLEKRYSSSWSFIVKNNLSLQRFSNVSLMFEYIEFAVTSYRRSAKNIEIPVDAASKSCTIPKNEKTYFLKLTDIELNALIIDRSDFSNSVLFEAMEKPDICILIGKNRYQNNIVSICTPGDNCKNLLTLSKEKKNCWEKAILFSHKEISLTKKQKKHLQYCLEKLFKKSSPYAVISKNNISASITGKDKLIVSNFVSNVKIILLTMESHILDINVTEQELNFSEQTISTVSKPMKSQIESRLKNEIGMLHNSPIKESWQHPKHWKYTCSSKLVIPRQENSLSNISNNYESKYFKIAWAIFESQTHFRFVLLIVYEANDGKLYCICLVITIYKNILKINQRKDAKHVSFCICNNK